MNAKVVELWRYPVKGLGGESMTQLEAIKGKGVRGDRRFALVHEDSAYAEAPGWQPKAEFLQLARDPGMAPLSAAWLEHADTLTLTDGFGRGASVSGCTSEAGERERLEQFADRADGKRRSGCRLVDETGTAFSDTGMPYVSIISLATLRTLSATAGTALDARRFRGNLVVDGVEPWAEFDWIDRSLWVGSVLLRPVERIGRCSATSIDPDDGSFGPDVPRLLRDRFGHSDCGVYAEIALSGRISIGNALTPKA